MDRHLLMLLKSIEENEIERAVDIVVRTVANKK